MICITITTSVKAVMFAVSIEKLKLWPFMTCAKVRMSELRFQEVILRPVAKARMLKCLPILTCCTAAMASAWGRCLQSHFVSDAYVSSAWAMSGTE